MEVKLAIPRSRMNSFSSTGSSGSITPKESADPGPLPIKTLASVPPLARPINRRTYSAGSAQSLSNSLTAQLNSISTPAVGNSATSSTSAPPAGKGSTSVNPISSPTAASAAPAKPSTPSYAAALKQGVADLNNDENPDGTNHGGEVTNNQHEFDQQTQDSNNMQFLHGGNDIGRPTRSFSEPIVQRFDPPPNTAEESSGLYSNSTALQIARSLNNNSATNNNSVSYQQSQPPIADFLFGGPTDFSLSSSQFSFLDAGGNSSNSARNFSLGLDLGSARGTSLFGSDQSQEDSSSRLGMSWLSSPATKTINPDQGLSADRSLLPPSVSAHESVSTRNLGPSAAHSPQRPQMQFPPSLQQQQQQHQMQQQHAMMMGRPGQIPPPQQILQPPQHQQNYGYDVIGGYPPNATRNNGPPGGFMQPLGPPSNGPPAWGGHGGQLPNPPQPGYQQYGSSEDFYYQGQQPPPSQQQHMLMQQQRNPLPPPVSHQQGLPHHGLPQGYDLPPQLQSQPPPQAQQFYSMAARGQYPLAQGQGFQQQPPPPNRVQPFLPNNHFQQQPQQVMMGGQPQNQERSEVDDGSFQFRELRLDSPEFQPGSSNGMQWMPTGSRR